MIAHLVPLSSNHLHQFRIHLRLLTNEKERCTGPTIPQSLQQLLRTPRPRTIIKRQRNIARSRNLCPTICRQGLFFTAIILYLCGRLKDETRCG